MGRTILHTEPALRGGPKLRVVSERRASGVKRTCTGQHGQRPFESPVLTRNREKRPLTRGARSARRSSEMSFANPRDYSARIARPGSHLWGLGIGDWGLGSSRVTVACEHERLCASLIPSP
jgi:hypothetical protein